MFFVFVSVQKPRPNEVLSDNFEKKININSSSKIYRVKEQLNVFEFDSLIKNNLLKFEANKSSFRFNNDFFWIHFNIKESNSPLLLELDNPHLDEVVLYEKTIQKIKKIGYGGDFRRTFSDRTYLNRRFIFPINQVNNEVDYYLFIHSKNAAVSFPLWLWHKKEFENKESKTNIFYGLYFGILFFVCFLSIITFFVVKKKVFLYYGLYILFLSLYLFTYLGFSFQYLYPNFKTLNNYTRFPIIVLFVIFLVLFINSFLDVKKNLQILSKVYSFIIIFFLLHLLFWCLFTDFYIAKAQGLLNLLYSFILIVIVSSFYAAYKQFSYNKTNAIIFYIAFSFLFTCVLLLIFVQYGFIDEEIFFVNPVILGSGFEILTLSIAMMILLKKMIISKQIIEEKANELEFVRKELSNQKLELEKKLQKNTKTSLQLKSRAVLTIEDILYIKSDGHYVEFYLDTKEKPEIDRNTMNNILDLLPSNSFVRIHKSYIVNIKHIRIINSNQLMLENGIWLSLSRTYKPSLKEILGKK